MKSTSPIWLSEFNAGRLADGKSRANQSGAIQPKNDGPSSNPAIISPTTGGCPTRPQLHEAGGRRAESPRFAKAGDRRSRFQF